jgi:hypothetical protein
MLLSNSQPPAPTNGKHRNGFRIIGYGIGKFLGWLVGTGITPHIPVKDMSDRDDGTFSSSDFTFDRERIFLVLRVHCAPKVIVSRRAWMGDT